MMGFLWFWLVAVMIVGYVVLDGFDMGVGVLPCDRSSSPGPATQPA